MISALQDGLYNVFVWPNILIPFFATLIMMTTSFLPGIGGLGVATFLMIVTLSWDPVSVLLLFGAIVGGATFMGSVTAILYNVPGSTPSAASMLDGFPLGQKGYPRTAIACSATASAVGSLFGVIVLISIIPIIRPILLEVGPFERLVLGIWGLTTIIAIPSRYPRRSLAMCLLGFLFAMIGNDPETGIERWTFSSDNLYSGLNSLVILLGLFTIGEILSWRPLNELKEQRFQSAHDDSALNGIISIFRNFRLTMSSSLIGTLVGIIPGIGGTVASFIAYGRAAKTYDPEGQTFGKGDIRGLIAPEAAVDAKDGGSLLPVIAFGLAGSEGTVILLAVLNIHGIAPGLPMLTTDLSLTFTLILSLLFSNLFTSLVGVASVPAFVRLKNIRMDKLALPALIATIWTAFGVNGNAADIYILIIFGILGYVLIKNNWPIIPFVLAFILSRYVETNFTMTINLIEIGRLTIFDRPISLIILFALISSAIWGFFRRKKAEEANEVSLSNLLVALGLLFVSFVFLIAPYSADTEYSTFAKLIAFFAFTILMYNFMREFLVYNSIAHKKGILQFVHEAWQHHSFLIKRTALFMFFAPIMYFFGISFALGYLIFSWTLVGTYQNRKSIVAAFMFGFSISLIFQFYMVKYSSLVLNKPALVDIFGILIN